MKYQPVFLHTAVVLATLSSATVMAELPLSYGDIINAERERMITNYKEHGGDAVSKQQDDETWLTNTPGTWGYIINQERLRMKQSQHGSTAEPTATPHQSKPNLMPTTLNEGVRQQHEQMKNSPENRH